MHLHPVFLIRSAPRRPWFSMLPLVLRWWTHSGSPCPVLQRCRAERTSLRSCSAPVVDVLRLWARATTRQLKLSLGEFSFPLLLTIRAATAPLGCSSRVSRSCIQSPEVIPLSCTQTTSLWQGTRFCSHMVNWIVKRIQLKANPAKKFDCLSAGCFPPSPHSCRESCAKRMRKSNWLSLWSRIAPISCAGVQCSLNSTLSSRAGSAGCHRRVHRECACIAHVCEN